MAERSEKKKLTENEAKHIYDSIRAKHEQELEKHRANILEYTLACEDFARAEARARNARASKDASESAVYSAQDAASKAFIELGRIQIELRGSTGR